MAENDPLQIARTVIANHGGQALSYARRRVLEFSGGSDAEQVRIWMRVVLAMVSLEHKEGPIAAIAGPTEADLTQARNLAAILVGRYRGSALTFAEDRVFRLSEAGEDAEADQWLLICDAIERVQRQK